MAHSANIKYTDNNRNPIARCRCVSPGCDNLWGLVPAHRVHQSLCARCASLGCDNLWAVIGTGGETVFIVIVREPTVRPTAGCETIPCSS